MHCVSNMWVASRQNPKKCPKLKFFWTTGDPRWVLENDIKWFHHDTWEAFSKKTCCCGIFATFLAAAPACLGTVQQNSTKFVPNLKLLSHKISATSVQGGWYTRGHGVVLTKGVFWPYSAHFLPLLPRTSTQSNEICIQGNHNMELLSPKISAKIFTTLTRQHVPQALVDRFGWNCGI